MEKQVNSLDSFLFSQAPILYSVPICHNINPHSLLCSCWHWLCFFLVFFYISFPLSQLIPATQHLLTGSHLWWWLPKFNFFDIKRENLPCIWWSWWTVTATFFKASLAMTSHHLQYDHQVTEGRHCTLDTEFYFSRTLFIILKQGLLSN